MERIASRLVNMVRATRELKQANHSQGLLRTQVKPATQVVGPVHDEPPHWPYAGAGVPVGVVGVVVVVEVVGLDVVGADVGADVVGADVVGALDVGAGAVPLASPKKIPRPLVPM